MDVLSLKKLVWWVRLTIINLIFTPVMKTAKVTLFCHFMLFLWIFDDCAFELTNQ